MVASPLAAVEIPEEPVTSFVFRNAQQFLDRLAVVDFETSRSWTYRQLLEAINNVARTLYQRGIRKGKVFGMFLPNCGEWAVIFHAFSRIGVTPSPANPVYSAEELRKQLLDSRSEYLVTIPSLFQKAFESCQGTSVKELYVISNYAGVDFALPADANRLVPRVRLYDELLRPDNTLEDLPKTIEINVHEDLVVLPYSSGTTGLPKGVMLTHHNVVSNLCQIAAPGILNFAPGDVLIACLPFFHIYGLVTILNSALRCGATVVTIASFEPTKFLTLLSQHKVTMAPLVPPLILFLSKHPMVDKFDLSALREVFSGAAPLGRELSAVFKQRFPQVVLRQGYGLTETSPGALIEPLHRIKLGSTGWLLPNMTMKIMDISTHQPLGRKQEGEIWLKGPNIMKGYLNNVKATTHMIDGEGYLHTGDVGYVDEDDCVFIVDRVKELIKVKGFQVAPAELEAILLGHPAIADVAVIGLPSEFAGELPKAFVVRKPGSDLNSAQVKEFVNTKVAPFKKIDLVEFIDAIPKTASGKILRRVLKDRPVTASKL
eukprot:GILK01003990.1.p1 GENE.GILK01003990.1~~GILK01003990.1.p1  ORF type:complete len:544 (-),score=79.86 GILK01003990.1:139-1770(-)